MSERLNVAILAPGCDGTDVGESWSCFQWVRGLSERCNVTLLTMRRPGRTPASAQLTDLEVVEWDDFGWTRKFERLASMLKPGYLRFQRQSRKWLKSNLKRGRQFDLIHQVGPLAMRYTCPGIGLGIPVIMGPLAGSLETPTGFRKECANAAWYTRLRELDHVRFRFDPFLRNTYSHVDVLVGVAPYVKDVLSGIKLKRFELAAETGVWTTAATARPVVPDPSRLRLLSVGRVVRTKGLRDVVRAISLLNDFPNITLDSAGAGEDLAACQSLANELGVAHRIRFHGRIERTAVEKLYQESDLFVFPSFREPSGNVIFEALANALPVITTDRGGPGFVVQDTCGIRVPANDPQQLSADVAQAIRTLASDPKRLQQLSAGAISRVSEYALWPNKIQWMHELYWDVVQRFQRNPSTSGGH